MDDIIKLFNPSEYPFGRLSNHSKNQMTINGERYDTVTNFILSSMMASPYHRRVLKDTRIRPTKSMNKELFNAIDHLLDEREKSSDGFIGTDGSIMDSNSSTKLAVRVAKILGKNPAKLAEWPVGRLQLSYRLLANVRRRKTSKETTSVGRKAWKVYRSTGKSSDFVGALSKASAEIARNSKVAIREVEPVESIVGVSIDSKSEIANKEEDAKFTTSKKEYISRYTNKAFNDVDLRALKKRVVEESQINQMGIYRVYRDIAHKELVSTLRSALTIGYETRLEAHPDFARTLIESGRTPISYVSPDHMLGVGLDGNGTNLVGQVLMQIRHNLQNNAATAKENAISDSRDRNLYSIFLAYRILKDDLTVKLTDIKKYTGRRPEEIVEMGTLSSAPPNIEIVRNLYKSDSLSPIVMAELFNPGTMVSRMRKDGLRNLQTRLRVDLEIIVLDMYLEYIVMKNYSDKISSEVDRVLKDWKSTGVDSPSRDEITKLLIAETIISQKTRVTDNALSEIKSRVNDMYRLGTLSNDLSDNIEEVISAMNAPTDDDVLKAESVIIPKPPTKKEMVNVRHMHAKRDDQLSDPLSESDSGPDSESDSGLRESSGPVNRMITNILSDPKTRSRKELKKDLSILTGKSRKIYRGWSSDELVAEIEKKTTISRKESSRRFGKDGHGIAPEESREGVFTGAIGPTMYIHAELDTNHPALRPLSPCEYTGMTTIGSRSYPTIQHYVIAQLIAHTGRRAVVDEGGSMSFVKGMGISDAHQSILIDGKADGRDPGDFLTIALAGELYDRIDDDTTRFLLGTYALVGLTTKFKDKSLQDLLLLTGDREIVWNSTQDIYLGIGTKENPGSNMIGNNLMSIREMIATERSQSEDVQIETDFILRFVESDSFVMEWVERRLGEMCSIVTNFQQYLKVRDDLTINIDKKERLVQMIEFTLSTVYQPNMYTVNLTESAKSEVPQFFTDMVWKCGGIKGTTQSLMVGGPNGKLRYNDNVVTHLNDINNEIYNLEEEFYGGSKLEHSPEDVSAFRKLQRIDWKSFIVNMDPDIGKKKRKAIMNAYKEEQRDQEDTFWGVTTRNKEPHEVSRHEHEVSTLKKEASQYILDQKEISSRYARTVKTISQLYWNRITAMLAGIINNAVVPEGTEIGQSMIEMELRGSSKATNCVEYISDPEENCILSAMLNLLTGILEFKEKFSLKVTLDKEDIDLAMSIIMGTSYSKASLITPDYSEEADLDEDDLEVALFPEGFDDLVVDDDVDGEYGEDPYFAFSDGDKGKVEHQVMLLDEGAPLVLVEDLIAAVKYISSSDGDRIIRNTRIGYFSNDL
jgi:predicted NAD-dependent protein-ADP-ribosyltransferase YbiA (DUF1768 family)